MLVDYALVPDHLKIVVILTVGLILATILGYMTDRLKLSPILGYLLAGYFIGPYSPGFVADIAISEQLAEIGVILMMFGVGLRLHWQELLHQKAVAIPGSLIQITFSTTAGALLAHSLGWSLDAALVMGISLGIASTVVLARVLTDNKMHNTPAGHSSLSWLLCEDFIAVIALLLLPSIVGLNSIHSFDWKEALSSFVDIMIKFAIFVTLLFLVGRKLSSYILDKIVLSHSHELFTLATLAITFAIVMSSVMLTGTSPALGAFIAGMLIGQTTRRYQVSSHLEALKDLFVVVFFLSIGMLFNPIAITHNFYLFAGALLIILVGNPFLGFALTRLLRHSREVAIFVALAVAQIGEFSFILAEEASKLEILPNEGFDIIVCCAFVSLAINPLLFRTVTRRKKATKTI